MVKVGADSSIWVSGQSIVQQGTQQYGLGAAFVGQAGFCSKPAGFDPATMRTYGFFGRLPMVKDLSRYDEEIGSIGKPNDVETAGGGRVVIYADSVSFEGEGAKIQANARPYEDFTARRYSLPGGSGGYIYVKTANAHNENSLEAGSRVEARGGYGIGEFTSGSGGVVVFDGGFNVPQDDVHVNGGVSDQDTESGCGNGAAGTVYRVEEDSLVVDNKGIRLEAATTVAIPEERQHNSAKGLSELAKKLVVQGKANLIIKGEHYGLTFNQLKVFDGSIVEFGQQEDSVNVRFTENAHIAKGAVLDFTKTKKVMLYQGEVDGQDTTSRTVIGTVFFRDFLAIKGVNVDIIGNVRVLGSRS